MDNKQPLRPILSRRDVLKLFATAGGTAAGGYVLFEYVPWLDYDQQVEQTWRPLGRDSNPSMKMRELIRNATLAANGHNTQPWKFSIKETELRSQFQSALGLGAFLPQLLVRFGYADPLPRSLRRSVEQVIM